MNRCKIMRRSLIYRLTMELNLESQQKWWKSIAISLATVRFYRCEESKWERVYDGKFPTSGNWIFINSCVNQRFNRMTIVLSPINVYFSEHDDFGNRCAQTIPKFGDEGKRYVRIFHRHICVCLDGFRLWNRLQCIQCVLSTHYHPVTNCFDVYSVVFVVV